MVEVSVGPPRGFCSTVCSSPVGTVRSAQRIDRRRAVDPVVLVHLAVVLDLLDEVLRVLLDPPDQPGAVRVLTLHPEEVQARRLINDAPVVPREALVAEDRKLDPLLVVGTE